MIVLADDDLYYKNTHIQKLYDKFSENDGKYIVSHAAKNVPVVKKKQNVTLEPYYQLSTVPGIKNKAFSGSGVLIKSSLLDEEIFNKEKFMRVSSSCDEFWLFLMAVKKGTKTVTTNDKFIFSLTKDDAFFVSIQRDGKDVSLEKENSPIKRKLDKKLLDNIKSYGLFDFYCLQF